MPGSCVCNLAMSANFELVRQEEVSTGKAYGCRYSKLSCSDFQDWEARKSPCFEWSVE